MSSTPPSLPAAQHPPQGGASDEHTEVFGPNHLAPKSVFPTSPHALPVGTRIGEFEVHRLIGEGGFGIVYLCYDRALDRHVALKEYMPASLATRQNATLAIVVKSKHHEETFQAGLRSFINEARMLAQFDHPSLLKVYRFWQANGTAYMSMPFYEGPTLKQALASRPERPDEATLRAWLGPLLDALEEIHKVNCYHRDIAPDNILLTASGPLLLDFGAARRVIGDMTQALTVVLKPGFAPIEQYGDAATLAQGAWTDLYALASVLYYAITGKAPMSAVDRVMDDKLEPLTHRVAGRYSHALLAAIDQALSVRPQDRPQSVAEFRALINTPCANQATDLHLWDDGDTVHGRDDDALPTIPGALNPLREIPDTVDVPLETAHAVPVFTPMPPTSARALEPTEYPDERTMAVTPASSSARMQTPVAPTKGLAPLSGQPDRAMVEQTTVPLHATPSAPLSKPMPAPLPHRPAERTVMPSMLPPVQAQTPGRDSAAGNTGAAPAARQRTRLLLWGTLAVGVAAFGLAGAWWAGRASGSAPVAPGPVQPSASGPAPQSSQAASAVMPVAAPPATASAASPASSPVEIPAQAASAPEAPPPASSPHGLAPAPMVPQPATVVPPAAKPTPRVINRVDNDAAMSLPRTTPKLPPVERNESPERTANPPASSRLGSRCSDLRQRAGLEDLSLEEREFLRSRCR